MAPFLKPVNHQIQLKILYKKLWENIKYFILNQA